MQKNNNTLSVCLVLSSNVYQCYYFKTKNKNLSFWIEKIELVFKKMKTQNKFRLRPLDIQSVPPVLRMSPSSICHRASFSRTAGPVTFLVDNLENAFYHKFGS
jgi:hypothetical protein